MMQQNAAILFNRPVGGDCWHMGLACRDGFGTAVAGQFVMLHLGTGGSALLRRPFSIFGLVMENGQVCGIELLYKLVGRVTGEMAHLQAGQQVNIVGPLGRGFRVDSAQSRLFLVAGGIGVAPIRFLASTMQTLGVDLARCRVFLGGRTQFDILCRDDFLQMGMPLTVTTDDGSAGDQCLITDPLAMAMRDGAPQRIFACGPHAMLKCVAGLSRQYASPCQLCLESYMACGIGACLGCALRSARAETSYLHVCKDGPVFDAAEIVL